MMNRSVQRHSVRNNREVAVRKCYGSKKPAIDGLGNRRCYSARAVVAGLPAAWYR